MSYNGSVGVFVLLSLILFSTAAPRRNQLVEFYPISRTQYDEILRMTEGKPIISEGRLINSGLPTLSDLRNSISNDISSGFRQILNITGFLPSSIKSNKEKVDGYPLCVIKTNNPDYTDDDDSGNPEVDGELTQGRAENEKDDDYIEDNRPVVSCIVVVKSKETEGHQNHVKPIQANMSKLRTPIPVLPYYYPPFTNPFGTYPAFPYYNYPYYGEARHNSAHDSARRSIKKTTSQQISTVMSRSNAPSNIRAEMRNNPNKGRSSYSTYYPYSYNSYNGGCENNPYDPYSQIYTVGNNYYRREDDDGSGEDDMSGEVAAEIGDEEY